MYLSLIRVEELVYHHHHHPSSVDRKWRDSQSSWEGKDEGMPQLISQDQSKSDPEQ
jgi:hypothetical protein